MRKGKGKSMPQKIVTFRKKSPGFVALNYAGETFVLKGVSCKSFVVDAKMKNPVLTKSAPGVFVTVDVLQAEMPSTAKTSETEAEMPSTAKTSETEAEMPQANDEKTEAASAVSEESAIVTSAVENKEKQERGKGALKSTFKSASKTSHKN
jgi:hypothetical protein